MAVFDGRPVGYGPADLATFDIETSAFNGRRVGYGPADLTTSDIERFIAFAIKPSPPTAPKYAAQTNLYSIAQWLTHTNQTNASRNGQTGHKSEPQYGSAVPARRSGFWPGRSVRFWLVCVLRGRGLKGTARPHPLTSKAQQNQRLRVPPVAPQLYAPLRSDLRHSTALHSNYACVSLISFRFCPSRPLSTGFVALARSRPTMLGYSKHVPSS